MRADLLVPFNALLTVRRFCVTLLITISPSTSSVHMRGKLPVRTGSLEDHVGWRFCVATRVLSLSKSVRGPRRGFGASFKRAPGAQGGAAPWGARRNHGRQRTHVPSTHSTHGVVAVLLTLRPRLAPPTIPPMKP